MVSCSMQPRPPCQHVRNGCGSRASRTIDETMADHPFPISKSDIVANNTSIMIMQMEMHIIPTLGIDIDIDNWKNIIVQSNNGSRTVLSPCTMRFSGKASAGTKARRRRPIRKYRRHVSQPTDRSASNGIGPTNNILMVMMRMRVMMCKGNGSDAAATRTKYAASNNRNHPFMQKSIGWRRAFTKKR